MCNDEMETTDSQRYSTTVSQLILLLHSSVAVRKEVYNQLSKDSISYDLIYYIIDKGCKNNIYFSFTTAFVPFKMILKVTNWKIDRFSNRRRHWHRHSSASKNSYVGALPNNSAYYLWHEASCTQTICARVNISATLCPLYIKV